MNKERRLSAEAKHEKYLAKAEGTMDERRKGDILLSAKNLSKEFCLGKSAIKAVKSVSLDIEKGSRTAITGPSGAGKSTLLHMLGGLDTPTEGSVIFSGRDIYRLGDRERSGIRNKKIGFVFQFYHLLPEFTVLENVIMPGIIRGKGSGSRVKVKQKAELLLGRMDLGHRIKHTPRELSGGEAQRVSIARALINDPDLLLCDEPTGNLDSAMGSQIYGILFEIAREKNMSMVVVTHQENNISRFDSVFHIKDGELSSKERAWA